MDLEDDELPAEMRGRCYTWPMQQSGPFGAAGADYDCGGSSTTSPFGALTRHSSQMNGSQASVQASPTYTTAAGALSPCFPSTSASFGMPSNGGALPNIAHFSAAHMPLTSQALGFGLPRFPPLPPPVAGDPRPSAEPAAAAAPAKKKRIRRRNPDHAAQKKTNPWGEESYSDLIARALDAAPSGRMKLNEIYQWFADSIPYFRERSTQEEAAGWKVVVTCFLNAIASALYVHQCVQAIGI